jgi:hypothetical protein
LLTTIPLPPYTSHTHLGLYWRIFYPNQFLHTAHPTPSPSCVILTQHEKEPQLRWGSFARIQLSFLPQRTGHSGPLNKKRLIIEGFQTQPHLHTLDDWRLRLKSPQHDRVPTNDKGTVDITRGVSPCDSTVPCMFCHMAGAFAPVNRHIFTPALPRALVYSPPLQYPLLASGQQCGRP